MLNRTKVKMGMQAELIDPSFEFTISSASLAPMLNMMTTMIVGSYHLMKVLVQVKPTRIARRIMSKIRIAIIVGVFVDVLRSAIVHNR